MGFLTCVNSGDGPGSFANVAFAGSRIGVAVHSPRHDGRIHFDSAVMREHGATAGIEKLAILHRPDGGLDSIDAGFTLQSPKTRFQ